MPIAPPLARRFARLTALNVLSNLTVPMASLVDTALLGHLPDVRFLAGVALASILFDYLYWTFGFLRMGTTGTTAQAWGRGDLSEVFRVLHRSLVLAGLLAAGILLFQSPLRELGFSLLSGASEAEAAGRAYFGARIWAAPAVLANFVLTGWFLGRGESGIVLTMAIVANLSNIVLDYLLIVRFDMAAFGAGLATAVSQYAMLACGWISYRRRPGRAPWRGALSISRSALTKMFRLNLDLLVRTVALITAFAVFLDFSAILGTAVLAANSVLHRLVTLAAYLVDGAAFAAESLGGRFGGAGDAVGFRKVYRLAMISGLLVSTPLLALYLAAPRWVIGLLTSQSETYTIALEHVGWLLPVLVLGALAYMFDGLYLGLTAGRSLRNAMLLSTVAGFLPLAILARVRGDNDLLWLALSVFMAARTVTLWGASGWVFPRSRPREDG